MNEILNRQQSTRYNARDGSLMRVGTNEFIQLLTSSLMKRNTKLLDLIVKRATTRAPGTGIVVRRGQKDFLDTLGCVSKDLLYAIPSHYEITTHLARKFRRGSLLSSTFRASTLRRCGAIAARIGSR
jgi:hypothetical protein